MNEAEKHSEKSPRALNSIFDGTLPAPNDLSIIENRMACDFESRTLAVLDRLIATQCREDSVTPDRDANHSEPFH